MASSGSIPVPRLFDIRRPSGGEHGRVDDHVAERDRRPCRKSPEKIIRFSQRRMISRAVTLHVARVVARRARASRRASRASRTARAPTRTTCRARRSRARARRSCTRRSRRAAATAQVRCPSGHVQIGIWWPHQSCRETHQSGAFTSESIANAVLALGVVADAAAPRAPRSPARRARPSRHHHCGETSGSIREWQRSQCATEWR